MGKPSPTSRSLEYLRKTFPFVEVVEHKVPYSFISQDLFGFADIIAINCNETYLVQTTTQSNVGARLQKILASSEARLWAVGQFRHIIIHGWAKKSQRDGNGKLLRNKKGKPLMKTWQLKSCCVKEDDFV